MAQFCHNNPLEIDNHHGKVYNQCSSRFKVNLHRSRISPAAHRPTSDHRTAKAISSDALADCVVLTVYHHGTDVLVLPY